MLPSRQAFLGGITNASSFNHSHSQSQHVDALQSFQQQQGGIAVKLEEQTGSSDQSVVCRVGSVRIESLPPQTARSLGPGKVEYQQSDSSLLLQQHAQQQLFLQLQQQQNQVFKSVPQAMQMQQQIQHGLPIRPQMKQMYEPGMCGRRLTQFMYHQQHRPENNNIDFWRKFVAEFFASNAKKRWCVSLYGSGRQTTGVFPQDVWHCEICKRKPGRGFEASVEVLPRLLQIKYASGTLEELLYVDMPRESHTTSGQIVLDYAKAVEESVFEQLRVVRDGQLRVVFNPDMKISSWEFCARKHEELIPQRLIMHQVSQLGAVVQKHQIASQNSSSSLSVQDLQTTCNSFVAAARQLAKALELPLVNDLGYTKRYVRCLQISEVVNSMKDLIDYSRETGTGPMDSLIKFPKRRSSSPGLLFQQSLQQDTQQNVMQNSSQNHHSSHVTGKQLYSSNSGVVVLNNSKNTPSSASSSGTPMVGLLHQNSINLRQENKMISLNNAFGSCNPVQIPSTSSSNSIQPSQLNMPAIQQKTQPHEPDPTDSQTSVQQMLQEMMMYSQLNGASTVRDAVKNIGSIAYGLNGANCLAGTGGAIGRTNNFGAASGMGGSSPSVATNGLRLAMTNNAMNITGRVGINHMSQDPSLMSHYQQQDMGNRLVRRIGSVNTVNSFDNPPFDWKPSLPD